MQLDVRTLVFWKTEHTAEDNEDACWIDPAKGRFAVADGVGESSFAHEWAPVLTHQFVDGVPLISEDPFEVEHWVRAAQKTAQDQHLMTDPEGMSGIARDKARKGAAATLLGLVLQPRDTPGGGRCGYTVTAVGDSNFFHWRPGAPPGGAAPARYDLLWAFPVTAFEDFGTLPDSINSRTFDRDNIRAQFRDSQKIADQDLDLQEGDILMLATDAVAQWILRCRKEGLDPWTYPHPGLSFFLKEGAVWDPAQQLRPPADLDWAALIKALRKKREIVNDDSTLLLIRVESVAGGEKLTVRDPAAQQRARTQELTDHVAGWLAGKARDVDVALAFGDGQAIELGVRDRLAPSIVANGGKPRHIDLWQANANAFKAVTDAIQSYRRPSDLAQRNAITLPELTAVWREREGQLAGLPWAAGLVQTIQNLQIPLATQPRGDAAGVDAAASAGVRKAIDAWVQGRGTATDIVQAYGTPGMRESGLAALIALPVPLPAGISLSHLDLWRMAAEDERAKTAEEMLLQQHKQLEAAVDECEAMPTALQPKLDRCAALIVYYDQLPADMRDKPGFGQLRERLAGFQTHLGELQGRAGTLRAEIGRLDDAPALDPVPITSLKAKLAALHQAAAVYHVAMPEIDDALRQRLAAYLGTRFRFGQGRPLRALQDYADVLLAAQSEPSALSDPQVDSYCWTLWQAGAEQVRTSLRQQTPVPLPIGEKARPAAVPNPPPGPAQEAAHGVLTWLASAPALERCRQDPAALALLRSEYDAATAPLRPAAPSWLWPSLGGSAVLGLIVGAGLMLLVNNANSPLPATITPTPSRPPAATIAPPGVTPPTQPTAPATPVTSPSPGGLSLRAWPAEPGALARLGHTVAGGSRALCCTE